MKKIQIEGIDAIVLIPENKPKQLAVVDYDFIARIAQSMPEVPFKNVQNTLILKIGTTENLEDMISVLESEINFHKTFNTLKTVRYEDLIEEEKEEPQAALKEVEHGTIAREF